MQKFLQYENFTAQEANRILTLTFLQITYSKIFAVFVLALSAKTIACYFKCGTKHSTLKMCILTEIAQVKSHEGRSCSFWPCIYDS